MEGLVLGDFNRLGSALDPAVRFRALAPGETVDVASEAETVEAYRRWFADKDDLELVEESCEELVDRIQLRYRLHLSRKGEPCVVEKA